MSADLYRAAGQAVAAYLYGAHIVEVTRRGIILSWDDRISRRNALLIELVVGLTGIAARSRYRFGTPGESAGVIVSSGFDADDLEDFASARDLLEGLMALGHDDILLQTWVQALELMDVTTIWNAIERIAAHLTTATLEAFDIKDLVETQAEVVPWQPTLIRPSLGAESHLPE